MLRPLVFLAAAAVAANLFASPFLIVTRGRLAGSVESGFSSAPPPALRCWSFVFSARVASRAYLKLRHPLHESGSEPSGMTGSLTEAAFDEKITLADPGQEEVS